MDLSRTPDVPGCEIPLTSALRGGATMMPGARLRVATNDRAQGERMTGVSEHCSSYEGKQRQHDP